jgi:hypothetical protein
MNESLLWQIRYFVYNHFADTTLPPSIEDTASHFNISNEQASALYRELHSRHALFLDPATLTIRMANPFSGIPTDFKVNANGKTYYANCAWDMLGIPVALHADAVIEAICTESNDAVRIKIINGQISASQIDYVTLSDSEGSLPPTSETLRSAQSDMLFVHFPLPFSRWYDDLTFT